MTATLLPNAKQQFIDGNGKPLAGASVYFYIPNTSTFKSTWQDSQKTILNTNPVILDASGEAIIWGAGTYRQVVYDVDGNLIWDQITEDANAGLTGDLTDDIFVAGTDFTPGVTTQLTLSAGAGSITNTWIFFDSAYQADDQIVSLDGVTLTFNEPIPVGVEIVTVKIGTTVAIGTPGAGTVTDASVAAGTKLYNRIHDYIDVKDYGATGNGTTDDTASIQAALTAAGIGGTINFPAGTYLVSATLNALTDQHIVGSGWNDTIFRRFADYGDTLKFANAGACSVRNCWFYHGTMPTAPFTTLTDQITAHPSSTHIRLVAAQGAVIEDVWAWRMPYQISLDTGSLVRVNRCNVQGVWDGTLTACEEGIAGIQIGAAGYIQLVDISHCYFGGSGNGPRNITYTSSDTGAHTINSLQNVGNQYSVLINQCEGLTIDNCYMGGNYNSNIFADCAAGGTCIEWRITNNFFDGAGAQNTGASIYFTTQQNGVYATSVNIAGNHFNLELLAFQAIVAFNGVGTGPALDGFTITGNTFQASVGSAMMFYNATGGVITGNVVSGYNAKNFSGGPDLTFTCGAFFGSNSHNISVRGNIFGGAVNSVASPSFCYNDVFMAGTDGSVVARDNFIAGGGASGQLVGRVDKSVLLFQNSGNYSMTGSEDVIIVAKTIPGSTQITPQGFIPVGYVVAIKDGAGNAATNPIQFIGTVDGTVNPVYNANYISKTLMWNGVQWNVIG